MTKKATSATHSKGWPLFTYNLARDGKLWLWIIVLLLISRTVLIWQNRHALSEELQFIDYVKAFFMGFKFDIPIATLFITPSFLCAALGILVPIKKVTVGVRSVMMYFFTITWVFISVITLGYFKEYHNQFDAHLLGIIYDDFNAIVLTVWQTYPVVWGSLILIAICAALIFVARKWIRAPFPLAVPRSPARIITRLAVGLLLLIIVFLGHRGTLGRRPIQRKDAAVTTDLVMNRCIMNPYTSLRYAIKTHKALMAGNGLELYLGGEDPLAAFQEFAGEKKITTIDDCFQRTASGRPGKKPKHIFLVIMESYNGWTMFENQSEWNVSNELKQLGKEGINVHRFLPGSQGTMTSLATIISGMADSGVITNERYKPGSPPYATAIAHQMERLGYKTHFWYAGYGGWQRIEDFCKEQGFDHTHMGSSMDTDAETNEWGVTDKRLFSYIESKFDDDTPTFNVILTSSNHPPYSVDLKKENCPITSVPPAYQKNFEHGSSTLTMLGHHWYSDKYMGQFVRTISKKSPDTLFAITGDHWGRTFPGPRPSAFERATVPLVLYGPSVLPQNIDQTALSGSHYDLGTTLVELAADPGHPYHAIGRNMLDPQPDDITVSRQWIIGKNIITSGLGENSGELILEDLDGNRLESSTQDLSALTRKYKLTHGVSWWRLVKGNDLPKK